MSSQKHFSRAALCLLSALSCASLFADTQTVQINSGTACSDTTAGTAPAVCSVGIISHGISSTGYIDLQEVAPGTGYSLTWNVTNSVLYGFTYKLSISSLTPGVYSVATPTGTYLIATVNGYLNYQYEWSTTTSGSGTIIITPASSVANFLSSDSTTEGTWTGKYGTTGYVIAADASNVPAFATVAISGASLNTWANPTTDTRGLQISSGSTTRIAADWYSTTSFSFAVNLTDGNAHNVSVYLLDWTGGRNEGVKITDAFSGATLDQEYLNSFGFGRWWTWQIQGEVVITVVNNGGTNAVASGLFFQ